MWSVHGCQRYRSLLALHAGNDLEAKQREAVERHARVCPDCRDHWLSLRRSGAAITAAAQQRLPLPERESLWREVRERLPAKRAGSRSVFHAAPDGSFGWRDSRNWALVSVSACVCVMLALVLQTIPQSAIPGGPHVAGEQVVPAGGLAMPVIGPPAFRSPAFDDPLLDDHRLGRAMSDLPLERPRKSAQSDR